MGTYEGRLRAMLDPKSEADWNLNAEDRAAIQWVLDFATNQKNESDELRRQLMNEIRDSIARRDKLREAIYHLQETI